MLVSAPDPQGARPVLLVPGLAPPPVDGPLRKGMAYMDFWFQGCNPKGPADFIVAIPETGDVTISRKSPIPEGRCEDGATGVVIAHAIGEGIA